MSAKTKLRNALSSIETAASALRRASNAAPDNPDLRRAIRELDDAESAVQAALRDVRRLAE